MIFFGEYYQMAIFSKNIIISLICLLICGCNIPNPLSGFKRGGSKGPNKVEISPEADIYYRDKAGKRLSMEEKNNLTGARMHNKSGMAAYQGKQYATAAEHFRMALRLVPDYVDAMNNLGRTLYAQGLFEEALIAYNQALKTVLKLEPDNDMVLANIHANMGDTYRQTRRYDKALEHYQEVLALKPKLPRAQYEMGNLYLKQGKPAEAKGHFQHALELDPRFDKALLGRAISNNLLKQYTEAWQDIMLLEERGYEINEGLRKSTIRGLEKEREGKRFRPGT